MEKLSTLSNPHPSMIGASAKITLTKSQLAAKIGDDVVLLGLATGTYYGLEAVAAHVWRYLHDARTFGDLVDEIILVFDVARDDAIRDISEFIRTLEAEGLVSISTKQAV